MKIRPLIIVIIICVLGIAASATAYILGQNRADGVFAGEVDVAALQRKVENGETFLVYFYGRSCDVCAKTEPYFVQALEQLQDSGSWRQDISVYKCERDANATVRSLYGVDSTPMYIYFIRGIPAVAMWGQEDDTTFRLRETLASFIMAQEYWEGVDEEPLPYAVWEE